MTTTLMFNQSVGSKAKVNLPAYLTTPLGKWDDHLGYITRGTLSNRAA